MSSSNSTQVTGHNPVQLPPPTPSLQSCSVEGVAAAPPAPPPGPYQGTQPQQQPLHFNVEPLSKRQVDFVAEIQRSYQNRGVIKHVSRAGEIYIVDATGHDYHSGNSGLLQSIPVGYSPRLHQGVKFLHVLSRAFSIQSDSGHPLEIERFDPERIVVEDYQPQFRAGSESLARHYKHKREDSSFGSQKRGRRGNNRGQHY